MKRRSFFTKLLLGNLLLVAVVISIAGTIAYSHLNANYQRTNEDHLRQMTALARIDLDGIWGEPPDVIDAECKKLFADSPLRLTVVAADGVVLGDSWANPIDMVNHKTPDRPEILAALKGKEGRQVRPSETVGELLRYWAMPLSRDGQVVGVVRVAMPVKDIAAGQDVIRSVLGWAAALAAAIAILLGLLLSWLWYAPLKRISLAARRIASGDLDNSVRVSGSAELVQLGAALDGMRKDLARQIGLIEAERGYLQTVVSNLSDAVIALDKRGMVMLMNEAAREMLPSACHSPIGEHLQAAVRIPDVIEAFNEAQSGETVAVRRLAIDGRGRQRTLDVHAIWLGRDSAEGIDSLIVVRDITAVVRAAEIKAEFVANASHELRTPLATIRAAVDSLDEVLPDNQPAPRKMLDMLDRHAARLEELTNDLLDLHLIETAKQQLDIAVIELASVVKWAHERFDQPAKDKDVAFEIETPDTDAALTSDDKLLQLILQNLLDNAIKFTPAGGSVKLTFAQSPTETLIRVRDTGVGVAPELQERVFERFFQADSARSGDMATRGSGLGLAIVKHAVERLGGTVTLQSQPGQGTLVEVSLPIPTPSARPLV